MNYTKISLNTISSNAYTSYLLLLAIALLLLLSSCEDPAPFDYKEEIYIEALLIVDNPIAGLKIMRTQPLSQPYDRDKAQIKNAIVTISTDEDEYDLEYQDSPDPGYALVNKSITVQPDKLYYLRIVLDGRVIYDTTRTPKRFEWIAAPKPVMHYPSDTLKLPAFDSLRISWTESEGTDFYIIQVVNKDTLEYGKYLNPPTDEKNRRCYNPFFTEANYRDNTTSNLISNTTTPTVWFAFKWFGVQDVVTYAPDGHFLAWWLQSVQFGQYQPLLSSFPEYEGVLGFFGSAAQIKAETFLTKNQP